MFDRVREALALRGAVLPLLSRRELDEHERATLLSARPESWRLLLASECCALAVGARMRERRLLADLATDVHVEIEHAEMRELQRVLAARTTLATLDQLAVDLGVTLIVFKGGVSVADASREKVDMGDVDVVIAEEHASRIWNALTEVGWRPRFQTTISLAEMIDSDRFVPLDPPGAGLPVDFHTRIGYSSEKSPDRATRPLPGFRALHASRGARAFLTLLRHTVIHHPHRRGHLRDLVFLADELGALPALERDAIAAGIAGDPYAVELREMFEQVIGLQCRESITPDAGNRPFVAWKYLAMLGREQRVERWLPGWSAISYLPLERPTIRRASYRALLQEAVTQPPEDTRARVALFGGGVPAWLIRLARPAYRITLVGALAASGWLIRRRMEKLFA